MTDHTVTIDTSDYGPVTIPEPSWCTGEHHADGISRADIAHTGPTINVTVGTERGPRVLVELLLWQDPYPTPAAMHSDAVHVAVAMDGEYYGYDPAALDALSTDLLDAAGKVRRMARRLAVEVRGGIR